jgi:rare lipoprotein A
MRSVSNIAADRRTTLASRMMTVPRTLASASLVLMLAILSAGCHKKVHAAKTPRIGAGETGIASWYGLPYHGRRAANGEIYDMNQLTAAHRTLPFDTWVRVKNLDNGRTVEVRIQDRGPFVEKRIIDLSRAAAEQINMIGPGTARVTLTIIRAPARPPAPLPAPLPTVAAAPPPTPPVAEPELFAVQIGAFQDKQRAQSLRDSMKERYGAALIAPRQANTTLWRVLVGREDSMEKAGALAEKMKADGTEGFVVRLDGVQPEIE